MIAATALLTLALAAGAEADDSPAARGELQVARATLLFHERNYRESMALLRDFLAQFPDDVPALELAALNQRLLSDAPAALATYEHLLKVAGPARTAPYHFEIASIQFRRKLFAESREHFLLAAEGGFQTGTSEFFLGLIAFQEKRWEAARAELLASLRDGATPALAPLSRYYLASASQQLGLAQEALRGFYAVENMANVAAAASVEYGEELDRLRGGVTAEALRAFEAFDDSSRFAQLSLLMQWDSNVQTNPSGALSPVPQSMQRSMKTLLTGAGGISTSPIRKVQLNPSIRFFTNYNWNPLTRDFNFISVTPSLLTAYEPYRRLILGFKSELSHTLRNSIDVTAAAAETNYSSFSLTGDVGPTARYEAAPGLDVWGELLWRPKKYFQDAVSGDARRTGNGFLLKGAADYARSALWNATAFLSYEEDYPAGVLYRFRAFSGGVSNVARFERLTVTGMIELSSSDYFAVENPHRRDLLVSLRGVAQYAINAQWSGLLDLGLLSNASTQPATYKYNRLVGSTGVTYRF